MRFSFLWWSGERGKLQNHWKTQRFLFLCLLFLRWSGGRGKLQNHWKHIHFHTFPLFLFVGGEVWEAPESLGTQTFLYIFITSLVERRTWEAPESMRKHRFVHIFITSSRIMENIWIYINFHYFFGGAESVGRSRIIENIWISIHFYYFVGGTESL